MAPLILVWLGRLEALQEDLTMPEFQYELSHELKIWFLCAVCKKEFGPEVLTEVYKSPREVLLNAAKKNLTICSGCGKWVCVDCWSLNEKLCKACLDRMLAHLSSHL